MKKSIKLFLAGLLVGLVLSWPFLQRAFWHLTISDKLNIGRGTAISTALSKSGFARGEVHDIETILDVQGSGSYPCYYIFFTYEDENGGEIRVRCAVDGENGEYLGMEHTE